MLAVEYVAIDGRHRLSRRQECLYIECIYIECIYIECLYIVDRRIGVHGTRLRECLCTYACKHVFVRAGIHVYTHVYAHVYTRVHTQSYVVLTTKHVVFIGTYVVFIGTHVLFIDTYISPRSGASI